jgi:predicted MFS family arabinose efflux permease
MRDILHFFTQRGIGKQIGFLLLYYSAMIGTLAMTRPYLVDLGYDIKEIGKMSGVFGTATGLVASFLAGFIIRKIGRFHSRILFAILILFTTFYFYLISTNPNPEIQLLYVGILLLWGSYGMATVAVYTIAMDCVREGREGTDFTIQTVITHFSGICVAMLSGHVADKTGYSGLFLFEFGLACLSLIYILVVFRKEKTKS